MRVTFLLLDLAHRFRRCQDKPQWKIYLAARIGSTFKVTQTTQQVVVAAFNLVSTLLARYMTPNSA